MLNESKNCKSDIQSVEVSEKKDVSYMYKSWETLDANKVGQEMASLLMDENITTYDMYEDLICAYDKGNEDFRKGMDRALEILLWKDLDGLVKHMNENAVEEDE